MRIPTRPALATPRDPRAEAIKHHFRPDPPIR